MSASLVGSEMCIRDRTAVKSLGMYETWGSSKFHLTLMYGLPNASFIPVSYTHLTLPTICSV
eukprot:2586796-Alexandrium_andersonii.AAC.1